MLSQGVKVRVGRVYWEIDAGVRHVFSVYDLLGRYFMIDLRLICMRLCYVLLMSKYSYLCDIYGGNMLWIYNHATRLVCVCACARVCLNYLSVSNKKYYYRKIVIYVHLITWQMHACHAPSNACIRHGKLSHFAGCACTLSPPSLTRSLVRLAGRTFSRLNFALS